MRFITIFLFFSALSQFKTCQSDEDAIDSVIASNRCQYDERSLATTSTCSVDTIIDEPFQIIASDTTTSDDEECCLFSGGANAGAQLKTGSCDSNNALWTMDVEGKIHLNDTPGLCITRVKKNAKMQPCEVGKKSQIWVYSSFDQNLLFRGSANLVISTSTADLPDCAWKEKIKLVKKNGPALGQAWKLQFSDDGGGGNDDGGGDDEAMIATSETEYTTGEAIEGTFINPSPSLNAWIAIYPANMDPQALPSGSTMWNWYRSSSSGSFTFSSTSDHGGADWPLCDGEWRAFLINGDIVGPYVSTAYSDTFTVSGGSCSGPCTLATSDPSGLKHKVPQDGDDVRRVAFSSCYKPSNQVSTALWDHVKSDFGADVWSWLGDNTYSDGKDMEYKRTKYNEGKENTIYSTAGPIANPKIAVTGTWDDHDFGANNMGKYYQCRENSQNEFALFFDLPESDPRHPNQGDEQRKGVYNSYMFSKPDGGDGIHLIHVDARYFRSPSFSNFGSCEGADSTILGDEQWAWLEGELNRASEVKIIGTGIQVLPPTYRGRSVSEYCSYDEVDGTFDAANAAVGEDSNLDSSEYEMWSEYPQERTKLLKLAQKSINDGNAKKVVFISGDQHWGEIQAKKMPADTTYGSSQVLYEVTGSGIDQRWDYTVPNANRVRIRSADYQGNGDFTKECNFPFVYDGVTYNDCTTVGEPQAWCSIETDSSNNHITGEWGYCLKKKKELVPRSSITYSDEHTCSENYLHVCSAQANYGGIEVDWDNEKLILSVFTPHETEAVAASVTLDL